MLFIPYRILFFFSQSTKKVLITVGISGITFTRTQAQNWYVAIWPTATVQISIEVISSKFELFVSNSYIFHHLGASQTKSPKWYRAEGERKCDNNVIKFKFKPIFDSQVKIDYIIYVWIPFFFAILRLIHQGLFFPYTRHAA